MIGFLNARSPQAYASFLAAFLQGLKQAGYVDGQNAVIEYRWAQTKRPAAGLGRRTGPLSGGGDGDQRR